MTDADRTFRYDPARLTWQWDAWYRRHAVIHPSPPGAQRLGFPTTFMGWTMAGARLACKTANIERAAWIAAQGDTPA
jgi:hypothetical protein